MAAYIYGKEWTHAVFGMFSAWMQSTTQYTRWLAMKQDTEKHSKDCLRDTSAKQTLSAEAIASVVIKLPIGNVTFPDGQFF